MTADCHTKGSIDRSAILALMQGRFAFKHDVKDYRPTGKRDKYDPRWRNQNHPYAHPAPRWRQMIHALYTKYSPHQLKRFDEIMEKYAGKEKELYRALLDRHEGRAHSTSSNEDLGRNRCRICGITGHWGNECPERKRRRTGPQGQDIKDDSPVAKKARADVKTDIKTEVTQQQQQHKVKTEATKKEEAPVPPPPAPRPSPSVPTPPPPSTTTSSTSSSSSVPPWRQGRGIGTHSSATRGIGTRSTAARGIGAHSNGTRGIGTRFRP